MNIFLLSWSFLQILQKLESAGQSAASCYCSDHHVRKASFSLCVWICSMQSLFCTFPNYCVWVCDLVCDRRANCTPVCCALQWEQMVWMGSEQSGPQPLYAEESCKMAPRRKSETCARLSVSGVGNKFRLRSVSGPVSTPANTQACMKARRRIKEWVLCLGEVLITGALWGGASPPSLWRSSTHLNDNSFVCELCYGNLLCIKRMTWNVVV